MPSIVLVIILIILRFQHVASSTKSNLVEEARLAEKTQRYDDLASIMKKVTELNLGLDSEERNLLSVGYENVINAKRRAWRIISYEEKNAERTDKVAIVKSYKVKIEAKISQKCKEILVSFKNLFKSYRLKELIFSGFAE